MLKTINEIQDEIIDEFSVFDDWMDRYSLLIDYGNGLDAFPESDRTEQNLIDGCQSKVWFTAQLQYPDGTPAPSLQDAQTAGSEPVIIYRGDSDAILVKGIVALLIRVLSGHTPHDIINADLYFIDAINLREHLSPTRSNGLASMLKQMRLYALAFAAQQ